MVTDIFDNFETKIHIMVFTIIFMCTSQKSQKILFSRPHTFMQVKLKKSSMIDKKIIKQNKLLIQLYFCKMKTSPCLFQKVLFFFFLLKGLPGQHKEREMTRVQTEFFFF